MMTLGPGPRATGASSMANRMGDSLQRTGTIIWRQRHSLAALLLRAFGVAAGFVVTFLIGRWFGPSANGQYAIVTQTAMFLSIIAIGGMDLAIVREFSRTSNGSHKLALSSFLRSFGTAITTALAIVVVLMAGGDRLLSLMGRESVPLNAVNVLCVILLARTMTRFLAAVLRSQSRFLLAQAVEVLLIPLGVIAMVIVGWARGVPSLLWATAGAGLVVAAVGLIASLKSVSSDDSALRVPTSRLLATALPLWGASVAQNLADWFSLVTVSAVAGLYDAGLYRVAAQFAMVFSLVSSGLFSTYATLISAAYHTGNKAEVARLAGNATKLSAALTAVPGAIFLIFSKQVMGVVGVEFEAGATLLRVLVVGQIAIALASPAGLVLALTGHPRVNLTFTAISAGAMLLLLPAVAHAMGAVGVAVFVSLALVGQNLAAHLCVRRLEGIDALLGRLIDRPLTV